MSGYFARLAARTTAAAPARRAGATAMPPAPLEQLIDVAAPQPTAAAPMPTSPAPAPAPIAHAPASRIPTAGTAPAPTLLASASQRAPATQRAAPGDVARELAIPVAQPARPQAAPPMASPVAAIATASPSSLTPTSAPERRAPPSQAGDAIATSAAMAAAPAIGSAVAARIDPTVGAGLHGLAHATHVFRIDDARPAASLPALPQPAVTLSADEPRRPGMSRTPAAATLPATPDIRIGTIALEIRAAPPAPVAPPPLAAAPAASAPAAPAFSMRRHYLRGS